MIDWLYINWPTLSGTLATIAVGVATVVVTIRLARPRMSLIYEIVVGAAATFRDYGVKPLPALSPLEVGHDYIVAITLLNAGRRTISSASFDAFRPISVEIGSVSQAERERFERRHEKKPLPAVVARELGTWYLVLGTWYLVLGTWYLVLGTWYLVLGTWYLVLGTCILARDYFALENRSGMRLDFPETAGRPCFPTTSLTCRSANPGVG